MHRFEKKRESLQEFDFKCNELFQAITNHEPKDITYQLKYACMFLNYLIRHAHPSLQKAIDNVQKIKREFLLAEGIQQT